MNRGDPSRTGSAQGGPSGDSAGTGPSRTPESSVGTSLEHLLAGSQGVIMKRLDLAVLEGEELLSRAVERAAMAGLAMILLAAAALAATRALSLFLVANAPPAAEMAAFAALNAVAAVAVVAISRRRARRHRPIRAGNAAAATTPPASPRGLSRPGEAR